jgi:Tol biopolymer transport system component
MNLRLRAGLAATLAVLVLAPAGAAQQGSTALLSQLVWFDRTGTRRGTVGPIGNHGNVELSFDGRYAAVTIVDASRASRDLWIYGTGDGTRRRFTDTDADETWAIWSRDGQTLVFNSTRNGSLDLFRAPAANGAMAMLLLRNGMWPVSWAADGRHVLFVVNSATGGNDVMVLPLDGDRQPYAFARGPAQENWATFAPNGRWVAFSSTESGLSELYVAPFPPSANGVADKRRVSPAGAGGSQARWSRDGRELFYIAQDRSLMVTAVDAEAPSFEVGRTQRLFAPQFYFLDSHGFDVAPDGQRLLVNTLVVSPSAPATVAQR